MSQPAGPFPATCVVDASVLIKLFLPEEGSEIATALVLNPASEGSIRVAPDLIYSECTNIFWKRVRQGLLSADSASENVVDLRALPLQVWPSIDLVEMALALAIARDTTVYDALYVVLAYHLAIPLITADTSLVRKLGGPGEHVCLLDSFRP